MIFGSVCSGIEAASVAWHPLGWRAAWVAEVDPFASAVLAYRWPGVPNLGDFTRIGKDKDAPPPAVDLLVGGTPCQSFSVAGKRAGLDDPRGNLTLEFLALAGRLRPRWLVWENVPGVLSIDGGRTFGAFLGLLGELGYRWAYRILDAQHFGLAQRRKRVFVVAHLGDSAAPWAVLLEPESLRGDPAPSRQAGEGVARPIASSSPRGSGYRNDADTADNAAAARQVDVARCLDQTGGFAENQGGTVISFNPRQYPDVSVGAVGAVGAKDTGHAVCIHADAIGRTGTATLTAPAGGGRRHEMNVAASMAVRRLTPRECERLQGFPDDYTLIPYRGKPAADGPRYKTLGNSMAVNVMAWLGHRIQLAEEAIA